MTIAEKLWEKYHSVGYTFMSESNFQQAIEEAMRLKGEACLLRVAEEFNCKTDYNYKIISKAILNAEVEV